MIIDRDVLRIARVFEEYPWLSGFVNPNEVGDIKILRLSEGVMNCRADGLRREFIILVTKHGELVSKIVRKRPWLVRFIYFVLNAVGASNLSPSGTEETILETIIRLYPESRHASYIVSFAWPIHSNLGNRPTVTIYKLPRDFPTMESWVCELKRRARNAIQQQIAAAEEVSS